MKTLVIKSRFALSAPLPGTPVMPTYDPSLMASYDASSMDVSGTTLTKWRNKQGAWGSLGDLVTAKSQFPISVDNGAAVFLGGTSETYMDSSALVSELPLGKATFIARVRFGASSDTLDCTIFSSQSTAKYAFARRRTSTGTPGTFDVGLSQGNPQATTTLSLAKEVWADVVLVVDGNNSKFYIDDQVNTLALGLTNAALPSLRLGANNAGANRLNGRISHFRIYNRAIALDELQEIRASM
ncbi:LamG domain-containing protein [Pseudomonas asiatica]|uniref:LamG domain-containing protein n=1 Tax=Pseudomonas asiatica TaxID=2219225 RepID=UPI002368C479|nr:LamG domain-containing protein [Pseudomonas asiatica]WDM88149.1 LamG domain-containing protein [Pseudomonas asiatica]